jgi:hypothetical protein
VHAKFNGKSSWVKPSTTLSEYINGYAPKSDGNNTDNYIQFMINKFNQVLGGNVITKDTPVSDIKEALLDAGLDADHVITQAHLSMENPKILKDLNIVYGKSAVTSNPMPPVRQATKPAEVAPKPPVIYNSNPTFGIPDLYPQEPKVIVKPTPAVVTPSTPTKPLTKTEIAQKVKQTFNIDLTNQQLDIAANPKLSLEEKLKQLGFIKETKQNNKTITETKDPGFLEKIGMYLFTSDVPIAETTKIKEAADGNPTEDEAYTSETTEVLRPIETKPLSGRPVRQVAEDPKIKRRLQEDSNFVESIGFKKVNDKIHKGKSYKNLDLGSYSKMIVDMSDGITVTYQPRNGKKDNRTDVNNAIAISDYLYDFDFTDNVYDVQADNQIQNLKYRWKTKDYTNQPFVQVRESLGNNKYRVKVKAVKDLTQQDFDQNKVYRQGYAKLSDFDISADQTKIKLRTYPNAFVGQGLPFRDSKNQEHSLRIPGGKGNFGKYQNINGLDQFGPYLGGTVTIISEDGKTVKKVSGSLKDILETAFYIKKQTGSKDVYFLQSDAGSMNIKADANNGKITKAQLAIARNQEPQAGAAEILLNE